MNFTFSIFRYCYNSAVFKYVNFKFSISMLTAWLPYFPMLKHKFLNNIISSIWSATCTYNYTNLFMNT